ncbi:MAG TPA: SDR family oxidoreductase, partial [Kineobactrum sp.]
MLAGKRVVLTGASGGIGQAFASALAGEGAQLVLVARNAGVLQTLCDQLPGKGHCFIGADLALAEGRAAVASGLATGVDLLIHNAGTTVFSLLQDQAEAGLREVIELNLLAPALLTQQLLPQLTAAGGTVVNIGSAFGSIGFPGFSAYSASKFGLRGFTEALRRELADTGVDVLYLAPRATVTDMNSPEVEAMNQALGNAMDTPATVAAE